MYIPVFLIKIEYKPEVNFTRVKSSNPANAKAFECLINHYKEILYDIAFVTDPDADCLGILIQHNEEVIPLTGNLVGSIIKHYLIYKKINLKV